MGAKSENNNSRDLADCRKLLAIAGLVYLLWWFAVELALPDAFNPLGSRLAVVAYALTGIAASFVNKWLQKNIRLFLQSAVWLITFHYFYLFFHNLNDAILHRSKLLN